MTASAAPGARRSSSSRPARRSAISRSVGALAECRVASPSSAMAPCRPPRTAGRWRAPCSRRRRAGPGSSGCESVRPRFSWMTSTAPFGAAAVASTPIRSPSRAGERGSPHRKSLPVSLWAAALSRSVLKSTLAPMMPVPVMPVPMMPVSMMPVSRPVATRLAQWCFPRRRRCRRRPAWLQPPVRSGRAASAVAIPPCG